MKRKVGAMEKVEADVAALRWKLKRDPQSYRDDFSNQYQQYETLRDLFLQDPGQTDSGVVALKDLIDFLSHTVDLYPEMTSTFHTELADMLLQHHDVLEYDLRDKIVGSLCLLKTKGVIDSITLLNTLFPILISTPSKSLRQLLFTKTLSVLRAENAKATNHKLNRTMQAVLFNLIESDSVSPQGIWAVKITREMWKRQIWSDARAVEVMRMAALSENEKVLTGGVRFFLGGDKEREEAAEESSDDDNDVDMARLRHQAGINKKTKKKARDLKNAHVSLKKKEKKKNAPHPLNFSALHLLHDPQGFAETIFSKHVQNSKNKLAHESKLLVLQLVSRLVGLHKLTVLSLYSYFLKHLTPRQASVTSYLACLAQATHDYVPPDVLEPLVQKIANEFVSEASASEVAAAGLNAIREICARQPLAMTDTLLQDLVMYRKSKDKGTMMAAKGLLSLYREVGADLLKKRDRGKDAAMGIRAGTIKDRRYGEEAVGEIEGIELLEKWKEEERRKKLEAAGLDPDADNGDAGLDNDEEDWKKWDVESDGDSDDSGGWINVESDGEDIQISDSEDEKDKKDKRPAKKAKLSSATPTPAPADNKETSKSVEPEAAKTLSKLLTTTILTPADLKQLQALRATTAIKSSLPSHKRAQLLAARHVDEAITAETIELAASIGKKNTKEEKVAMAKADRETNHQSTTAMRKEKKESEGKSTTNKEKARKKNFLMTLGKAKIKNKRSLGDVKRTLLGHIERKKRGGKRGNKGN
ncbi:SDA1-domain-containing protein [Clathrospora elynae]|uniref:Protein SDA1 n=1 Tax=Clathrospora elynae TaxID=706981 RepID=A0A6A5T3H3_9PLEO|nr:SDA1-domain-containing protein [Clathrospora elynae]